MMKRFFAVVLLLPILCLGFVSQAQAVTSTDQEVVSVAEIKKIDFSLFHSETCPHCKDEIEFIEDRLFKQYGEYVDFHLYEVNDPDNLALWQQYAFFHDADIKGVPMTFIDGEVISGFGSEKTTGKEILRTLDRQIAEKFPEFTSKYVSFAGEEERTMTIPLIGDIQPETFSLPLLTVILGILDGFNPCAMWVLLFLISLLLGIEDRKRMWLLGTIFIFSSGIVYFFFMAAWLKFLMFVGMVFAVRLIIGVVAVGIGVHSLKDYWDNRKNDGLVCKVSNKKGATKTFDKIKEIVYKKSIWWAVFGIVLLGFSVNLVELACSAGFPAIFTQVLSLNDLPQWKRYLYMFGYIIFYMLDDMIIFILAMITLQSKTVGSKYAKYANLAGGILMFVLGLLLVFKPQWLMFS
ncbi:hypothetical protein KKG22_01110 [Patescibacteria group bacterium]|nr:hypothetical protein [Patescibacteria group bacterium]MBU1722034.1 hypothetical protein [Patescibacteria group bacterium]MBU1901763.1 hypothetical protein [Patescibacteria group bacterium]